jgi:DNA-binding transcriptional LysR family regulator
MDLEELRAFLAVVEAGSFLAAADALGISRTTLRRRVDTLEARAGVALVESSPAGVQVTAAGSLLAERGRQMVLEGRALLTSIRELGQAPSGLLRIGLPVGLPPHTFTTFYASLREVFPALTFAARFGVEPRMDALLDHDMIAHFADDSPPGPWLSYVIARPKRWLIASPDYLQRHGTPRTPADLSGHDLFIWGDEGPDSARLPLLSGGSVPAQPIMTSPDIHLLRSCCIAGLGIGFIPDALLPDPGDAPPLIPVLEDVIGGTCTLRLTVPQALAKLPKIKSLLDKVTAFISAIEGLA